MFFYVHPNSLERFSQYLKLPEGETVVDPDVPEGRVIISSLDVRLPEHGDGYASCGYLDIPGAE